MEITKPGNETTGSSRIHGIENEEAGFWTKFIFWLVKRRMGNIPLSTRIRAHDPRLLTLSEGMSKYTASKGALSSKLKELVQLKVAVMVGCPL
jgi:hypothetical protein